MLIDKMQFAEAELEYLDCFLTHNGIHPQPKNLEAILCLQPPNSKHMLGPNTFLRASELLLWHVENGTVTFWLP